jgi:hypothetical protein
MEIPARQHTRHARYISLTMKIGGLLAIALLFVFHSASVAQETDETESAQERRLPRRPIFSIPENFAPEEKSEDADFQPYTDRWRIVPPPYEVNVPGRLWDPYNQNILKGDLPIIGNDIFLNVGASVDTLLEFRKLPTPCGVSADRPFCAKFFGKPEQFFVNNNVALSADLFKGLTAFRPFDWRVKATFIGNVNYLDVKETAIVNPDVRKGTNRTDGIAALQEGFGEYKLADLSPNFDFLSIRGGIQPFNSDFRGFVFSDTTLGVRIFGNYESNRSQFNVAYFDRLEKDTNSGLNTLRTRGQSVLAVNYFRQDFPVPGLTQQLSIHRLAESKSFHFDDNGFLARPDPVGVFKPHSIRALYFGWTGSGKIDRLNIEHAFYHARGRDSRNPIAGRDVDIKAFMSALELSYDRDWLRPKISYFFASGDGNPRDATARGFDSIFDNPVFVGGGFSFWNRLAIKLTGTGVNLVNRGSLLPDLRSSKEEGQPNFVNPGIHIGNVGLDVEVTPTLKLLLNANYLRFAQIETLQLLLFQSKIRKPIGWDLNLGLRYRPFNNNNVMTLLGFAAFLPGRGFKDIYESGKPLFTAFTNLNLTF